MQAALFEEAALPSGLVVRDAFLTRAEALRPFTRHPHRSTCWATAQSAAGIHRAAPRRELRLGIRL